jgi:hypothetical protein
MADFTTDQLKAAFLQALREHDAAKSTSTTTDKTGTSTSTIDATKSVEENLQKLENQRKLAKELSEITGDTVRLKIQENDLEKEIIELQAQALIQKSQSQTLSKEELKDLAKYVEDLKEINKQQQEILSAKAKGAELAKLLGIDENNKNSLTYRLFSEPKAFFQGFNDQIKNAGGITQTITAGIIKSIEQQSIKAFFAYDNAAASLAKVAGANAELQSVLENTSRGATAYGISFAEAGKAIEGLQAALNTFSTLSQQAKEEITTSTAKLERLGISSQQSAKSIATLTQIMGMTEVQAAKTNERLSGLALAIGRTPQQVASDFASASDKLGAYGKNMIEVFENLETQAKGTGVAVNDLLRIAEQFQTFEGAASAAGKLNAALGGGFVNAMELLEASAEDPTKAIDLLRTRLNDAGLAFNQMTFYEQKLIAQAGGFKSVEEASRILSMSNAEKERAAKADAERAEQQKLVDEAVQRTIPIQQKLELLMANFAIVMGGTIETISNFVSALTEFIDKYKTTATVIGVVLALLAGFLILGKIIALFQGAAAAFGAAGAALGVFNTSAVATAPAATPASLGITLIGNAAFGAAKGLLILAVVLLAVGAATAGIGLLFKGIASLVGKFVELFKVIANTSDLVPRLAGLIAVMSAFSNPLTLTGMVSFASGIAMIATELRKIPEKTIVNFATVTDHVAKLATVEKNSTGFGKQTKEMIDAINSFNLDSAKVDGLNKILEKITPQQPQTINVQSPPLNIKLLLDGRELKATLNSSTDTLQQTGGG